MRIINIYLLMENKSLSLKLIMKTSTFQLNFVHEAYLINFNYVESKELSFKGNFHDFSVDYGAINKSDILDIHKYLMVKNK